jgi:hypothetical protein
VVGGTQSSDHLGRGFPVTIRPLPHGAGLLHRAQVRDELGTEYVAQALHDVGRREPDRLVVGLEISSRGGCRHENSVALCHIEYQINHNPNHMVDNKPYVSGRLRAKRLGDAGNAKYLISRPALEDWFDGLDDA